MESALLPLKINYPCEYLLFSLFELIFLEENEPCSSSSPREILPALLLGWSLLGLPRLLMQGWQKKIVKGCVSEPRGGSRKGIQAGKGRATFLGAGLVVPESLT